MKGSQAIAALSWHQIRPASRSPASPKPDRRLAAQPGGAAAKPPFKVVNCARSACASAIRKSSLPLLAFVRSWLGNAVQFNIPTFLLQGVDVLSDVRKLVAA